MLPYLFVEHVVDTLDRDTLGVGQLHGDPFEGAGRRLPRGQRGDHTRLGYRCATLVLHDANAPQNKVVRRPRRRVVSAAVGGHASEHKTETIRVRVSPTFMRRVERAAKMSGVGTADYVRMALGRQLERDEDRGHGDK